MLIEAWKPVWGGGQAHVWHLAKELVKKGYSIDLFVMGTDDVDTNSFDGLQIIPVGNYQFSSFKDRLLWCGAVSRRIVKEHENNPYDLIHAHANLPGWPARKASEHLKIPAVYTIHGSGIQSIKDMYGRGPKSWLLAKIERKLHRAAYDATITVDKSPLEYLPKGRNTYVIPNGVDIEEYDSVKAKKVSGIQAVSVGRLHPQKGYTYLNKALAQIKDKLPKNFRVIIMGKGELKEELEREAKQLGVNHIIEYVGAVYGDEKIKKLKESHFFILPSLYEGQPLTLLEAWAANLPVLVTKVGANEEFVKKENGVLVKPKDIDALAVQILKLAKMKKENLSKQGKAGYNMVKKKHSWESVAKQTEEVYNELL